MMQIDSMIQKFAASERVNYLKEQQEVRSLSQNELDEIAESEEAIEYFENNS